MPLTGETDVKNLEFEEVQQSQVSSSRPFLLSSLEPCVFEALKTPLLLLRVDGSVQFASRCVNDVLGIGQEEIIGKHVKDFIFPDDYSRFEHCLLRLGEVQRIYSARLGRTSHDSAYSSNSTSNSANFSTDTSVAPALRAPTGVHSGTSLLDDSASHNQNSSQSRNQNQLLIVPEFKKQTFICRVRRLSTTESSNSTHDTQTKALHNRTPTSEYFNAEVTAFARWCSDEEVGGVENATRILSDPHKQLCLFCVLKRCGTRASVATFGTSDCYAQTAALCSSQPTLGSTETGEAGETGCSLIELLNSDPTSFPFESETQSLYHLGLGTFNSCVEPIAESYESPNFFDNMLGSAQNSDTVVIPPVGADSLFESSGTPDATSSNVAHLELTNALPGHLRLSADFGIEPIRLRSPAQPLSASSVGVVGNSRTPTPTGRPQVTLALAPSQLAVATGRTTPQHGRPSGGSESKKLRELLLKGSTGADSDASPARISRSCSVEQPIDASPLPYVALRRGSSNVLGAQFDVSASASSPGPSVVAKVPTPTSFAVGIAPSKLESHGGWQKDMKTPIRGVSHSSSQQSILVQLLNNDEPSASRESEASTVCNTSVSAVTSISTVTSTTTSTSRQRAKRGLVKESVSPAVVDSLATASRNNATKRASSLPISELLDPEPASGSGSISSKFASIVQNVALTAAYPLRGQPNTPPQSQLGKTPVSDCDQSTRFPSAQSELEKLLCETSHSELQFDATRRASGEPTTTTGILNAAASAVPQSQTLRSARRPRTNNQSSAAALPATHEPQVSNTKSTAKRRPATGPISDLLSSPSPAGTGRQTNAATASLASSTDLNEVANMLYDYSDTSEQMQNTRVFSDISTPASVSSKRRSSTAAAASGPSVGQPKAAKLDAVSNSDNAEADGTENPSGLGLFAANMGMNANSGALMTLLTSNSPPDQFSLSGTSWLASVESPGAALGSGQRPISRQTNTALSNYVRSKQRALSANTMQQTTAESESNPGIGGPPTPQQFGNITAQSSAIYQQLASATPEGDAVNQFQLQALGNSNQMVFGRFEPSLGELGVGAPLGSAGAFTVDMHGQPVSGQPLLIGANGQPVSIGPYVQGPVMGGPPPRLPSIVRPPPPSYQMTTAAMQLAHPQPHISDNIVSSTTGGFDMTGGIVSSTISPAMRPPQPPPPQSMLPAVRNVEYAQLNPLQMNANRAPTSSRQNFSPDNAISGSGVAAAAQSDEISLYLESLSTSELDSLINSVAITLPPSTAAASGGQMPNPINSNSNSNSSVQFVGANAAYTPPPQYTNLGVPQSPQMHAMGIANYPMRSPGGVMTVPQRPNAPAQFCGAASQVHSPSMPPPPNNQMLVRSVDPPAFGMPQQAGAVPMVLSSPLSSPVRRSGLNQAPLTSEPANGLSGPTGNPLMATGMGAANQSMLVDAGQQNQSELLSGSKLAELMKASVPPNVSLPPGTQVQIPVQSTQASIPGARNLQLASTVVSATSTGGAQQKAGLIANQIVKEAELKQQQAAQSQAGLLQQLQARSKLQRAEQGEFGPSPLNEQRSQQLGSGAGPPLSNLYVSVKQQMSGSVLASLINSPTHSPVTGAPPSAFVSSTATISHGHGHEPPANAGSSVLSLSQQQLAVNPRVPPTSLLRIGPQPTPPSRYASSLSATPSQLSPAAGANGPFLPSSSLAPANGSAESELTDEIIETLEQLSKTHPTRLARRSGSRSSIGEVQHAAEAPPRAAKRHDSMLERLLAENN